jgi:NADH-quinone oxidoreductase subunit E
VLTEDERRDIDEVLPHYADRRSGLLSTLKIVQRHRGWIADEAVRDVAAYFDVTVDDVESRATFYNLLFREPVGRHVILVCDSIACWVVGYEELRDALKAQLGVELGGTTADGRFTLLPIVCLGACDRAPAMMVDDDLHGPVTPADLAGVLARYP